MDPLSLDPEDDLCLRIGRLARAHVFLDTSLRLVHQSLIGVGNGRALSNRIRRTGQFVEECREMLEMTSLDERFNEAANSTLTAAGEADARRSDVVHDLWLRGVELEGPPRWFIEGRSGEAEIPPRTIALVDEALVAMNRAIIRVHALGWGLDEVLPRYKGRWVSMGAGPHTLAECLRVMEDRFELLEDGGFQIEKSQPIN